MTNPIRKALEFYASAPNYHTTSTGFAAQYDPEPPAISKDHGDRARAALAMLDRGQERWFVQTADDESGGLIFSEPFRAATMTRSGSTQRRVLVIPLDDATAQDGDGA